MSDEATPSKTGVKEAKELDLPIGDTDPVPVEDQKPEEEDEE